MRQTLPLSPVLGLFSFSRFQSVFNETLHRAAKLHRDGLRFFIIYYCLPFYDACFT